MLICNFHKNGSHPLVARWNLLLLIVGIAVARCLSQVAYDDGKSQRRLDLQRESHCNEDWEFPCKDGHNCIARYDQCDGIAQCPDGSDEENCQHRYERPNQNFNEQQRLKTMNRPVGPNNKQFAGGSNSQQNNGQQKSASKGQQQLSAQRRLPMEFLLLGASAFVIVAVIVHIVMKLKRRRGCMGGRGGGVAVRGFRKGESLIDDEDDLLISQAYS